MLWWNDPQQESRKDGDYWTWNDEKKGGGGGDRVAVKRTTENPTHYLEDEALPQQRHEDADGTHRQKHINL